MKDVTDAAEATVLGRPALNSPDHESWDEADVSRSGCSPDGTSLADQSALNPHRY